MIPGIGIDLLHLPRLSTLLSRRNGHYLHRFARRILTRDELAVFQQKLAAPQEGAGLLLVRWLGVRWAAKEAAFKARGSVRGALGWKEVEVGYHPSGMYLRRGGGGEGRGGADEGDGWVVGQPYLAVLQGREKKLGGLSISHDGEYVIAMAMLPTTTATATVGEV